MAEISLGGARFQALKKLTERATPAKLKEAGDKLNRELEEMIGEIVQRTQSGRDVEGGSFVPYSEGYAKWKRKKIGRHLAPDLTLTGKMLGSVRSTVKVGNGEIVGRLFVLNQEADKAKWNQRLRKFFGLSKEQRKTLIKMIKGLFTNER